MVRFLIPVWCYSLSKAYGILPHIISQKIYYLFLGAKRVEIALVPRDLICYHVILYHGKVCKALNHKFQPKSNDLDEIKISNSLYLALR